MSSYHLAVDLGASGGRVALGHLANGQIEFEILYRFSHEPIELPHGLYWDILGIWQEVLHGLRLAGRRARQEGFSIASVGVDSWGVDYALLDKQGTLLDGVRCYRDPRTQEVFHESVSSLGREVLYRQTGIQFMPINTLYQLESHRRQSPQVWEQARYFLMIPDLLHYWLSGKLVCEYTNASTTQLYNPSLRTWADLAQPYRHLFPQLVAPGTVLGSLLPSIAEKTGLEGTLVVVPATHDTASAVAAVPAEGRGWAYLSSGTWSLLGIEVAEPILVKSALDANLTNEVGLGHCIRLLKNISGLWILQESRRAWGNPAWATLFEEASHTQTQSLIDTDDHLFSTFGSDMPERVQIFCKRTGQPVPQNRAEITRCVLESLALKYRQVLEQLEQVAQNPIRTLYVVGGGSQIDLLNSITTRVTGRTVVAGPVDATLLGNLLIQALGLGNLTHQEVRSVIKRSCSIRVFENPI